MNKIPAHFMYRGERYAHITPAKRLLNSTMVYDVIMRGDIFGMNMDTQVFTIISREEIEFLPSLPIANSKQ
jgi:hypothetical protein